LIRGLKRLPKKHGFHFKETKFPRRKPKHSREVLDLPIKNFVAIFILK
jgi:hypothetical protein